MAAHLRYSIQGSKASTTCGTITSIGRDRGNDIVLLDSQVSRQHAIVRRLGKTDYYLIDSGSANGSRVNGRRITTPTLLADSDRITIGGTTLSFEYKPRPYSFNDSLSLQETVILDEPVIKEVTVLVADMRGYTRLSEQLSIQVLTRVMNQWFEKMSAAISESGGTVDKFIGDCVFARWEGDRSRENVLNALRAACVLEARTSQLHQRFPELAEPLRIGVGINSGMASVEVGSENTALGDTVNTAFRLETASKQLGTDIVLSESAYRTLAISNLDSKAQQLKLKGKVKGVKVVAIGFEQARGLLEGEMER